ncbi:MAG: PTS lactose/cellobiose transporter subunit IIA [Erysipelotrichaceae bacterium]|nr:PTS lactose/cellobiose transporter subunit IIA [Erysipelotrichaceae bacterium]
MDDNKYSLAFEIISEAGDAKSKASEAIALIQNKELEAGEQKIKEAKKSLVNAHHVQTKLIQQECTGESVDINIIMVHAQDHFSMATTMIDMAEIILKLYRQLEEK